MSRRPTFRSTATGLRCVYFGLCLSVVVLTVYVPGLFLTIWNGQWGGEFIVDSLGAMLLIGVGLAALGRLCCMKEAEGLEGRLILAAAIMDALAFAGISLGIVGALPVDARFILPVIVAGPLLFLLFLARLGARLHSVQFMQDARRILAIGGVTLAAALLIVFWPALDFSVLFIVAPMIFMIAICLAIMYGKLLSQLRQRIEQAQMEMTDERSNVV